MSVGQDAAIGALSYLAFGRELTYGTYVTGTAGLDFNSATFKMMKETKILEEVQTSRTNSHSIQLGRVLTGDVDAYFSPANQACNWLLHNAFGGGPVTSATASGDTVGAVSFTHQIDVANFAVTYSSLSVNMRKGGSTPVGKVFEYCGLRVDSFGLKADLDDAVHMNVSLIGKDASLTTNDVSSKLINTTTSILNPLSFVAGRFSAEITGTALLTTTSFWNVISVEWKVSNNLNSDANARRIGSDTLQVLPPGLAQFELKCTVRFDTTTAYDAMIAGTRYAAEFEFFGPTLSGSAVREGLKVTMPYVQISDAGDPDVGGPNDPLTCDISFVVLRDPTNSGYACRAFVTNNVANYT